MKSKNIFLQAGLFTLMCCSIASLPSCTKKYGETNIDKNSIAEIGASELPFLFSGAIESVPWSDQVAQNLFADQYAQYFACNVTYFASDRLVMVMDWVENHFAPIYTRVVPQLQTIFEKTEENSAEHALAEIWWVYAFHRVTDYWGPIPYFNAGVPGSSVPYDPQDKIYDDFFKRLDAAVTVLQDKTGETPFGSYDVMFGGSVPKWIKFANTLRLRLALRISKADPARAKTEAEAAYAGGVFTSSPEDDAYVLKNNNDNNRISVMSDWNEFRMSAAMESVLKGYNDPRTPEYFIPAVETGTFEGLRNGLSIAQLGAAANKASANSHVGPRWSSPAAGGIASFLSTSQIVMTAAEAYFLRAEGALLGWSMGGTPKELYEAGITNSMKQWGVTDNTAILNYINGTTLPVAPGDYLNSPAMTNVPVKFNAANAAVQREQIATQKWICLFPDGAEAWAEYRRSHLPKLYPVANSDNPDITNPATQWIRRIPFLLSEKISNGAEVEKAAALLGGADKITTPLWWDKN